MTHTINPINAQHTSAIPFVNVSHMLELINTVGIETLFTGMVDYLKQDFSRWSSFDKSPRFAAHSPDGVIELMPIGDEQQFSFKYVNGHPKNTQIGLQTVTAFGVLSDVASGYPILFSEMTLLTALRTAATSAMMAQYLAPEAATTMALIGCGAQSEFQALAFNKIIGITQVRLYDIDDEAMNKCRRNLDGSGLDVIICHSCEEAIHGAHIITTCTADKKNATIVTSDMVQDGVHINAIGGDCPGKTELDSALLTRARVFVEYEPQTRIEGDIQQLPDTFPVTEMFEVITGKQQGRMTNTEITIFDGVGFAIEDFSALRYIYHLAKAHNLYQTIDILANPHNPRDLFGLTLRSTEHVAQVEKLSWR